MCLHVGQAARCGGLGWPHAGQMRSGWGGCIGELQSSCYTDEGEAAGPTLPRAVRIPSAPVSLPPPLQTAAFACAGVAALAWLVSIATRNYSQVDRLWSILPPLYVAFFAAQAGFRDPRLDLMAALTALWGARLTYNFARKGGYRRGSEDYRWPVLRKRLGPVGFQLLNATFIAPYQNLLLLLIAL